MKDSLGRRDGSPDRESKAAVGIDAVRKGAANSGGN